MAIASYNSKRIIPAPFVSLQKNYTKSGDGKHVGVRWDITLQGTIIAYKGSPDSSGVFYTGSLYDPDARELPTYQEDIEHDSRIAAIFRKQEALRQLFSEEGHSLEFQSFDGSPPIKCNPRITSITFSEGIWVDRCEYTITCEADAIYVNGQLISEDSFSQQLDAVGESWAIDTDESRVEGLNQPRTYILKHNVSATGKRFYDETGTLVKEAWQQARDYVIGRLGLDNAFISSSGVPDLPSYYSGFNHVRVEDIDKNGGSYSVNETWILASGASLEDFTVNLNRNVEDGLTNVRIEGNITGLEERDSNLNLITTKYENASTRFIEASGLAFTRAQVYSGQTLNIEPKATTIGKNPVTGTINYSFEYDTRPSCCIPGARSEKITISDTWNVQKFAEVFVLGRTAGPVLQYLGTKESSKRTLDIEVIMPPPTKDGCAQSDYRSMLVTQSPRFTDAGVVIQKIIDAANPGNYGAVKTFVSNQNDVWDATSGRYRYTVTFTYEQ